MQALWPEGERMAALQVPASGTEGAATWGEQQLALLSFNQVRHLLHSSEAAS